MKSVFLDHAATTPMRPEVTAAMVPYLSDLFGNASSIHRFGQRARKSLENARKTAAEIIGAAPGEIFLRQAAQNRITWRFSA